MSQPPSAQSVAEIRTNSGSRSGQTARTASTTSRHRRMRLSNDPPYSSVRGVDQRREELVNQIAVRGVDLDARRSRPRARVARPSRNAATIAGDLARVSSARGAG